MEKSRQKGTKEMKNRKKILIIILAILIILILFLSVFGIIWFKYIKKTPEPEPEPNPEPEENVLIVGMNNTIGNETPEPEPEPKPKLPTTPAEWTISIENSNSEIGTLYIPKTKLNTPVYCKQSPEKMEKMPCFLYTSGGINKPGVTCFTGHNRRNGKLFSNNKKLQIGDAFYFKDNEGVELEYTIIDKYTTVSTDTGFFNIETDKPIIALSCCTDASNDDRIIITGRAD